MAESGEFVVDRMELVPTSYLVFTFGSLEIPAWCISSSLERRGPRAYCAKIERRQKELEEGILQALGCVWVS